MHHGGKQITFAIPKSKVQAVNRCTVSSRQNPSIAHKRSSTDRNRLEADAVDEATGVNNDLPRPGSSNCSLSVQDVRTNTVRLHSPLSALYDHTKETPSNL